MTISRFLLAVLFSVTLILGSCKKQSDVHCETAVLEIHNPDPTRSVIFTWEESYISDTLFPGESVFTSVNNVHVEYDMLGEVKSSTAPTVTIIYEYSVDHFEVDECHKVVEATGGFVDFSEYCNDGVYNPEAGENDLDCGPFCKPCTSPVFTCNMANDQLEWTEVGIRDGFSSSTDLYTTDGFEYTFSFYPYDPLVAHFHIDELPETTKRFDIGYLDNQVSIDLGLYFYSGFSAEEGQFVYLVKEDNGDWFLEFCDLQFEENNSYIHGSAKLALDK